MKPLLEKERLAGSRRGVQVREAKATLKNNLKQSRTGYLETLATAIKDPDSIPGKLRILEFLRTLPGVGKVKAQRFAEELSISSKKRLGGLGIRQQKDLEVFLKSWLERMEVDNG